MVDIQETICKSPPQLHTLFMEEIIQFHCPVCQILLRVPAAAAGRQGPCPVCGRSILAPPAAVSDPFKPFPGSSSATDRRPPLPPRPEPFSTQPPSSSGPPSPSLASVFPAPPPLPPPPAPQEPIPEGDPRPYFRVQPEPPTPPASPFSEPVPEASREEVRPFAGATQEAPKAQAEPFTSPPPATIEPPPEPITPDPPRPPEPAQPPIPDAPPSSAGDLWNFEPPPAEQEDAAPPVRLIPAAEDDGMFTVSPSSEKRPVSSFPAPSVSHIRTSPAGPAAGRVTTPPPAPESPFSGLRPDPRPTPRPPEPHLTQKIIDIPALGRLRWAVLVLASLLFFLVGLVTGQILALKGRTLSAPIFHPHPRQDSRALASGDEPPAIPPEPTLPAASSITPPPVELGAPEAGEASEMEASRAVLESFLDAVRWEDRQPFVIGSEGVEDRMKGQSLESGEGPIAYTGITGPKIAPQLHNFTVTTPSLPQGFPVTLFKIEDQWKIDWDMFQEFHDDLFHRFAAGDRGDSEVFHLFVKPGESGNEHYSGYQLSAPIEGRSYGAFAKKGSEAEAKLQTIFGDPQSAEDPVFQQMLKGVGLPVILELSTSKNSSGQRFLLISDLVARYWGPEA